MKFNIDKYKGDYAMHCKTYEEVESFRKYLNTAMADIKNRPNEGAMTQIPWDKYKEKTAFNLNGFGYGSVDEYKSLNYTILEWSDYAEDTVCEKRIDRDYLNKVFDLLGVEPYEEFTILNEDFLGRRFGIYLDLTVYENIRDSFEKEIPLVESNRIIADILRKNLTIQKAPKISEKEQLAIDYAKACGYSWLVRDDGGIVWAYKTRPEKNTNLGQWFDPSELDSDEYGYGNTKLEIGMSLSFLSYRDTEPYYIGD